MSPWWKGTVVFVPCSLGTFGQQCKPVKRTLYFPCIVQLYFELCHLTNLCSVSPTPDEIPFWTQQVPFAYFLPINCRFRPSHAYNPRSQLLSITPSWVSSSSNLLWWDRSQSSLFSAVDKESSRGRWSCRPTWCNKYDILCYSVKPRDPGLPSHAQPWKFPLSKNY